MYPWLEFGSYRVPSYILLISLSYCIAIVYAYVRAKKLELNQARVLDICLWVMISGLVGSRALHVVWEEWAYYREDFFRIFYLWQGGFVFFGGALLAFFSTYIYLKRHKENIAPYLDLLAPVVILGYAIGRLSCFLAGCCFGSHCDLPWAVQYPAGVEAPSGIGLHPTPIYASLWATGHWLILIYIEKKQVLLKKKGDLFYIAILIHSLGRLIMEFFRADHRGDLIIGISISSWVSILLLALGVWQLKKKS